MMKYRTVFILLLLTLTFSCNVSTVEEPAINTELTEAEKSAGIMSPEILWKFGRVGSINPSPDKTIVLYTVTSYDLTTEARQTNIFSVKTDGGETLQLTTSGGGSPQWFSSGSMISFVKGGELWTMKADGSSKKMVSGFGDFEAYSISPTSDKIMFTRRVKLDQTPNEKHNMPEANMRIIDDLMFRHWNYWHDYSYSHIFIASFNGSEVSGEMDIMEGQRFESPTAPYFDDGEISWSPDGTKIAYTSKHLIGKEDAVSTNSDIFIYNLSSQSTTNLTEGNLGQDKYPTFSPDGSTVAWLSMKEDGYEADLERLFISNLETGEQKWVSEGWDYNIGDVNWTDDGSMIYFTSPYRGTTQIFNIEIASGAINQISSGKYNFGPITLESERIISGIQSMSMALEIGEISLADGELSMLTSVNNHIYDNIKMGNTEERIIKTSDNKDLQMWVIYPPDFDPAKSYPTLLYCKGGPQGDLGQGWSFRWNYQMMAANGYIVVAPNRRGNSGFGSEWREQISGDYGGLNMEDYLNAIDYMAEEPFVDKNRLGAVGASYGGYSVFWLAGVHEGRFKAFISHCGMYNIESWYGSTEEMWFPNKDLGGAFWETPVPVGYKYSPHINVDKWDTPILIITGEHDYRIPYTQSLEAFNAAQLRGVPSRLLFFHDETHFVTRPQNAVIWQREFFSWLDTYLK
jgi:dipeptidyl aminopeptidase/acylaminoacyl peptidase